MFANKSSSSNNIPTAYVPAAVHESGQYNSNFVHEPVIHLEIEAELVNNASKDNDDDDNNGINITLNEVVDKPESAIHTKDGNNNNTVKRCGRKQQHHGRRYHSFSTKNKNGDTSRGCNGSRASSENRRGHHGRYHHSFQHRRHRGYGAHGTGYGGYADYGYGNRRQYKEKINDMIPQKDVFAA